MGRWSATTAVFCSFQWWWLPSLFVQEGHVPYHKTWCWQGILRIYSADVSIPGLLWRWDWFQELTWQTEPRVSMVQTVVPSWTKNFHVEKFHSCKFPLYKSQCLSISWWKRGWCDSGLDVSGVFFWRCAAVSQRMVTGLCCQQCCNWCREHWTS